MGTQVKVTDLGSTTDVATMLGISAMTASKRRARARMGFTIWWPEPIAHVAGGELYHLPSVRAEAELLGMRPARIVPTRGALVDVDDLAGVGDLAEMLEVDGANVHSFISRREANGFPEHLGQTGRGLLFSRAQVLAWADDWNRRPQRGQARKPLAVGS